MIEVEKLTLCYGPVTAVDQASFVVRPKEIVGLLGPNGAGKSTILKVLTTYLWPTAGTARVCGRDVRTAPLEVRRRIGYLPEVLPLYPEMEVGAYLDFVGRARALRGARLRERRAWVVERCGLAEVLRTRIRELSKGYRQRTALAQALLHDPEVVILDEPTSGLDPHQILAIRRLVRELAREKTVIFSTHILQEVEAVADRIVIISRGEIVADGTLDEVAARAAPRPRLDLAVAAAREAVEPALKALPGVAGVEFLRAAADVARFRLTAAASAAGELRRAVEARCASSGWRVVELLARPPTLEETFLALTEAETPVARGAPRVVAALADAPAAAERPGGAA